MNVPELIADLVHDLRSQKLRAFLTIGGVTWGTLAIVLLLAFGQGLERKMHEDAAGFGQSIVIAWPSRTTLPHAGFGRGRQIRLEPDDVLRLQADIPELEAVCPEYVERDQIRVGERVHRVSLSGVYPSYASMRSVRAQPGGRFLDDIDLAERRRVVFLGDRLAAALFGDEPPVGRRVVLRNVPFTVIGVLQPKEQNSDYDGLDEDRAILPATTHARVFGRRTVTNFVFRARDPRLTEFVTRRVHETLGRRFGFDPDDPDVLAIWDTTELERMLFYIFFGFELLLGLSGTLTLMVGGLGVANLMYILVRRRTREIGIHLAVGARPRQVLVRVLAQALALVAFGGGTGLCLALLCTSAVRLSPLTDSVGDPSISPLLAVLTAALLGGVGLLAGYFPARRAARMDPVQALSD